MKIIYERESKREGSDCMIFESAFVVEVESGFVATRNTIYHGWFGFDARSQSFVFDNAEKAIAYAEGKESEEIE